MLGFDSYICMGEKPSPYTRAVRIQPGKVSDWLENTLPALKSCGILLLNFGAYNCVSVMKKRMPRSIFITLKDHLYHSVIRLVALTSEHMSKNMVDHQQSTVWSYVRSDWRGND